jgi:lipopolysaccharide export system protein LptA
MRKKRIMNRMRTMRIFSLLFLFLAAVAWGDVFTFRADRASGGRATGREVTVLRGNEEVRSDKRLLHAARIEIHGSDNRFVDCTGNGRGHEEDKNILFITDRLRYDRTLKIARLEGNSTMEDLKNELVARGRFIEYDDENEIAVMQISVRLFKDNLVCRSEYALYNRGEETLVLSGFPVVYKKEDEYRADRIRVDLDTDDVIMEGDVKGSIRN